MMMPKRVIVRGDDAGSGESANRALQEAAGGGLLRNISVMAPGPALADAARRLAGRPGVCFGLHVTLNSEWDTPRWGPVLPRAEVPSLVDGDSFFWRTPAEALARGAKVGEMLAEASAQLLRLREAGFSVSYADEHMGVSWPWPELRAGLAGLAASSGLLDAHAVPFLPESSAPHDDPVDGIIARLRAAPSGDSVLVTHPAYDDAEMQGIRGGGTAPGEVARWRDSDRRLLLDPRLSAACREFGIEAAQYVRSEEASKREQKLRNRE